MIKALISDFSRVILFPKDPHYQGSLNGLHKDLLAQQPDYDRFEHFQLNTELLEFYRTLKPACSLAIYTSDAIQEDQAILPHLSPLFDQIFSAAKMGNSKKDTASYREIAQALNLTPGEIIYVDDAPENTKAASQAGMKTVTYQNNHQIIQAVKELQA